MFTRVTAGDLASGWTQVAKLTAGDGAAMDRFARALSIDGDTVVIGAYGRRSRQRVRVRVHVESQPGDLASGWTQVAKLTADDAAASDQFGVSVSIDGDTVVVGAHGTGCVHRVRVRVHARHRPATSPPTGRRLPS